jgi:hypothetical protein
VEGVITNALTGEPIPRAHVVLNGSISGRQQQFGAVTTAEGKFSINSVPPASYSVTLERVGFLMGQTPEDWFARGISLQSGEKKDGLNLKLVPVAAIIGRVVDGNGEPMEGVNVSIETAMTSRGPRAGITTNEKGEFRIGGLAAGRYSVKASSRSLPFPPEVRSDGTVEIHYASTYYPNTTDLASASPIRIGAGAEVSGIEIRMVPWPIVRLSGTVTGLPKDAQRAFIEVHRGQSAAGNGAQAKSNGTFELWRLDPGKYRVVANCSSGGSMIRSTPVEIEVTQTNIDGIELRMVPPADLIGQVEFEDEQARNPPQPMMPGSTAQTPKPPQQPRRLMLTEVYGSGVFTADLMQDGSFAFHAVQPGTYRLFATWNVFVKSTRLGDSQTDGDILDLRNGAGAPLSALVSTNWAELSGVVNDDKGPASGVVVALVREGGDVFTPGHQSSTGPDGSYKFSNVAPGRYTVAALDDDDRAFQHDSLAGYEDILEAIEFHPGDKVSKDLKRHPR